MVKFLIQFKSCPDRNQDDRNHLNSYSGVFCIPVEAGIFTFLLILLVLLVFQKRADLIRTYHTFL